MPASARSRRPTSMRAISRWSDFQKAERIWLDGVLAYLEHNPTDRSRSASPCRRPGAAPAPARTVAWRACRRGQRRSRGATRTMLSLEAEIANRAPIGNLLGRYPLLVTVNRLLAARWLRSLGEDTEAVRVLAGTSPCSPPPCWRPGIAAWECRSAGPGGDR